MATDTAPAAAPKPASPYSRTNPFPGKLTVNRSLCGEGSEKDTRHFEIDLSGWGLNYEVGDSMTVWATNDPALVDDILKAICAKGDEPVKGPKGEKTLREALLRDCRITQTTPKFLKMITERANAAPLLKELLAPSRKEDLDRYLWGMEVIDFLNEHPSIKISPQEFIDVLAKLQPRLYSISSSLKAHPEQVHFTIDVVKYTSHGRQRKGVCSTFLAERANDVPVPVFPMPRSFGSRKMATLPSSWSAPARALRRSAPIYKSEKQSAPREKTGSSSDRRKRAAIIFTRRSSTNYRKTAS
jgi:sulfite reductase (NADPH) flavoprotein alpha-component